MTDVEKIFKFSDVPPMWQLCFNDTCPRHDECLRYLAGQHVPGSSIWGNAVYPTVLKKPKCPMFKPRRIIRAAYGFKPLFSEVKQKHYTLLRDLMKEYLGGHSAYYRYNRGQLLLTPEKQQGILDIFARYGYTEGLRFEQYIDTIDFS